MHAPSLGSRVSMTGVISDIGAYREKRDPRPSTDQKRMLCFGGMPTTRLTIDNPVQRSFRPIAAWVVNLVVLGEYRFPMHGRDADTRVPAPRRKRSRSPISTQPMTTPPAEVFLIAFDTRLDNARLNRARSLSMGGGWRRRSLILNSGDASRPCPARGIARRRSISTVRVSTGAGCRTYEPSSAL